MFVFISDKFSHELICSLHVPTSFLIDAFYIRTLQFEKKEFSPKAKSILQLLTFSVLFSDIPSQFAFFCIKISKTIEDI